MTYLGGAISYLGATSRNMINICNKYGFDSLTISVSCGGHRRHTTDNVRGMT